MRTPTRYDNKDLRREAGKFIAKLRSDAGLSQNDLAKLVGQAYYTFVSQVETGVKRVPPEQFESWANALQVKDKKAFYRRLFSHYDPVMYELVIGPRGALLGESETGKSSGAYVPGQA